MKEYIFCLSLFLLLLANCSFSLGDERFSDMEYVIRTLLAENKDLKARIDKLEALHQDKPGNLPLDKLNELQDRVLALEDNCGISDRNSPTYATNNYGDSLGPSDDEQVNSTNETDAVMNSERNMPLKMSPKHGIVSSDVALDTGNLSKRVAESEVAFHVYLSGNRCYSNHEIFKFDGEAVDVGGGYNINDGIFDAPATGLYVFSWTVAATQHTFFSAELIVNGVVKGVVETDSDLGGTGNGVHPVTGVVLANVNAGNHVYIRFVKGAGCSVESDAQNRVSFTGWLLL